MRESGNHVLMSFLLFTVHYRIIKHRLKKYQYAIIPACIEFKDLTFCLFQLSPLQLNVNRFLTS